MTIQKVLITGTLGFIFSNVVRQFRESKMFLYEFVGLDKAVKNYNLDNMLKDHQYKFYFADLGDQHNLNNIFTVERPDIVIGGAAESFVDNSITDIMPFLHSNIIGTQNLINMCLKHGVKQYIHISTDEVYGHITDRNATPWRESDPMKPRNPYSASKACAEHIVIAAHNTHGLQYKITRSCNVFGPRQKDENLVPHIINSLLHDKEITIHGDGKNFRQYVYVKDLGTAFADIMIKGQINSTYNIGDENFLSNMEMVEFISRLMNIQPRIRFIRDRKAHDFGYKVCSEKVRELGWRPTHTMEQAMRETIDFYEKKWKVPVFEQTETKRLNEMRLEDNRSQYQKGGKYYDGK